MPTPRRSPRAGPRTNQALLVLLGLALVTGTVAFGTGTVRPARAVTLAHGLAGVSLLLLVPWKQAIIRRGLRRRKPDTWASILLAMLVAVTITFGFVHTLGGLVPPAWPLTAMQVHVGAALALVPFALSHVQRRPQKVRRVQWQRREAIRTVALLGAAGLTWTGAELASRALGARGAARRGTGSHARPSPVVTVWLNDRVPAVDPATWALTAGGRRWSLVDLTPTATVRATIDCTNGWQSTQDWRGVPLAGLLGAPGEARSILVRSATGYVRRFPVADLPHLLVSTHMGGRVLEPEHGYPARLVAPGRRGFWWVKWVDHVELSPLPWWVQPPFPLT